MATSFSNTLCVTQLSWPVEVVPLQIVIVEPRKLTPLEWVVLRVVDEFRDAPPTVEEATRELGLGDAVLVADTLASLVRWGALTKKSDAPGFGFQELQFTPDGERFYRKGMIVEGAPSTRGAKFYVDALTDEDLPPSERLRRMALQPCVPADVLPRTTLGLARVREVLRVHHPRLLTSEVEVLEVRTADDDADIERPSLCWRDIRLSLQVSSTGVVSVVADGLSAKAQELLTLHDPIAQGWLSLRGASDSWARGESTRSSTAGSWREWCERIAEVVPAEDVIGRVRGVISRAKTEVVAHACWCVAEEVHADLCSARERGVRVLVVGADDQGPDLHAGRAGSLPQVAVALPLPGALVVDGTVGLLLDDVSLTVGEQNVLIELAGTMHRPTTQSTRAALVDAALETFRGPGGGWEDACVAAERFLSAAGAREWATARLAEIPRGTGITGLAEWATKNAPLRRLLNIPPPLRAKQHGRSR